MATEKPWGGRFDAATDETDRADGAPLLKIYNPVLQPWSGQVVAVSEFHEIGMMNTSIILFHCAK